MSQLTQPRPSSSAAAPSTRVVVAVVLTRRGRIGVFRRSAAVAHDRGAWHCITGYVDDGVSPTQQALAELHEETGLRSADLTTLVPCGILQLPDAEGNLWDVYVFGADTDLRRLRLNEEHDAYRWVRASDVARYMNRVSWLDTVIQATTRSGIC
jgi:8-oxo-dGTP pyrophosphatase MutT (NUDIX family)